MTDSAVASKKPRGTFAWALWDWAEQPFPTIFSTFIFPIYITSSAFGPEEDTSRALGLAATIAGIAVALVAPVFGRRSDEQGRRKLWLLINTLVLSGVMASLFFIAPTPEMLWLGLIIFSFGGFVQEIAFINYYAMLKQVSTENNIGKVSGFAWGLGYVGGIILLLVSLVGFVQTDTPWFGIPTEDALNVRAVFLFSAIWLLVFSIPLFITVPEVKAKENLEKENIIESYFKLWSQLKSLRKQAPETFKFLISSAIYRDGLSGVFAFGGALGSLAFGFELAEVIIFGIAANLMAGIGAAIGGFLDDKVGGKMTIMVSLLGLTVAGFGVFAFASAGPITYWIGGLALTLFVGPAQAASRSFVAKFTPAGREGEVFGLYMTTGRAVSFLSPLLWTTAISIALSAGIGNAQATVYGILGLMLVLVVGILLLARVSPTPQVIND
ncbi:MFS transporter [Aquiluna sp. KACHI24]|uniref:MFS transporter n=1 Tax=Aquiluna sp. KACHI24 TaxID=2968831 RepID=UPI00220C5C01|nr:MFS transporter [Aquiluna sp. KACHI24]BDQ01013.1 MFS transporter [Aquiluna sp. KACHI24]